MPNYCEFCLLASKLDFCCWNYIIEVLSCIYILLQVEDDHLLDSTSCVRFLIKLLNPPIADTVQDKATTIGSRLLGIPKKSAGTLNMLPTRLDSSSTAIMSKVLDILVNSKEIKKASGDVDGIDRPELSSKWLVLLTMEKACTSTVSFEGRFSNTSSLLLIFCYVWFFNVGHGTSSLYFNIRYFSTLESLCMMVKYKDLRSKESFP